MNRDFRFQNQVFFRCFRGDVASKLTQVCQKRIREPIYGAEAVYFHSIYNPNVVRINGEKAPNTHWCTLQQFQIFVDVLVLNFRSGGIDIDGMCREWSEWNSKKRRQI